MLAKTRVSTTVDSIWSGSFTTAFGRLLRLQFTGTNSESLNARLILAWNVLVGFCTVLQIIELNRLQDDAAAAERSVNQTRPDSALAFHCQVSSVSWPKWKYENDEIWIRFFALRCLFQSRSLEGSICFLSSSSWRRSERRSQISRQLNQAHAVFVFASFRLASKTKHPVSWSWPVPLALGILPLSLTTPSLCSGSGTWFFRLWCNVCCFFCSLARNILTSRNNSWLRWCTKPIDRSIAVRKELHDVELVLSFHWVLAPWPKLVGFVLGQNLHSRCMQHDCKWRRRRSKPLHTTSQLQRAKSRDKLLPWGSGAYLCTQLKTLTLRLCFCDWSGTLILCFMSLHFFYRQQMKFFFWLGQLAALLGPSGGYQTWWHWFVEESGRAGERSWYRVGEGCKLFVWLPGELSHPDLLIAAPQTGAQTLPYLVLCSFPPLPLALKRK